MEEKAMKDINWTSGSIILSAPVKRSPNNTKRIIASCKRKLNTHIEARFGDNENLKPLLEEVWFEYKSMIRETVSNETDLFERRQTPFGHRENRETPNKRKAQKTPNSTQKTQPRNFTPQEKKHKTKDQKITKTTCDMCRKGLQINYPHKNEDCWNYEHEKFAEDGSLVKKSPEEKKALQQSFNNNNKFNNNYFEAYNAQHK